MIRTVLIDDERPALKGLEFMLKKYEFIQIVGMYTNPIEAIDVIANLKPDVVFLDIEMPQLRGIDAASAILDACEGVEIIFVTAYDQYAIEAFELNSLDYLLKPVATERMDKSIARLVTQNKHQVKREVQLQIRLFGGIQMCWKDRECIKWRAEKTKELFLYLLQNRNRSISKDELLDQLWPNDDPSRAVKQLYNGIYYIRKNLEEYGIGREFISIDSKYKMTFGEIYFDIERFNTLIGKLEVLDKYEEKELIELMAGEYLEGEYYPWIDFERDRYNRLHENIAIELSKMFISKKLHKPAEELLLKFFNKNKTNEEIVSMLIRYHLSLDNLSKAHAIYEIYVSA